jgi:2-phospho-L-lactate/phosphoenolpyruvate guanylyltransferase
VRTIAILPIKSFGAAKQRLAGLLGTGAREALVQAMFQDVLLALRHVPELDAVAVVSANVVAHRAARGEGVILLDDEHEAGHSEAATIGIRHAVHAGFDRVLLVAGDTPLLDPGAVSELLNTAEAEEIRVVVVGDRHGTGTNALLLEPPTAIVPAFGPGSRRRHEELAATAGASCRVAEIPSLAIDVDTPEDLTELSRLLEASRVKATMTRGALRQLDRSRASSPAPIP